MKPFIKITLLYFSFGALWIFLSDRVLSLFANSQEALTSLQTYKGWFFIIITSILLYFLMRKMFYELKEGEKEKEKIFITTMRVVHHILNNFLHKMLFIKESAKENKALPGEMIELLDEIIWNTNNQIKSLSTIDKITSEEIEKVVYTSGAGYFKPN